VEGSGGEAGVGGGADGARGRDKLCLALTRPTIHPAAERNHTTTPRQNRRKRAKELLNIISGLGPAVIKAGQALSSRPDLLPTDYLEELQKLQDRLPPFQNELAFKVVEQELGVPFDQVFELEEEDPIAAASIGQVYKARLRSTGEVVAVKVSAVRCSARLGPSAAPRFAHQ
jgi:predicted unusual protein kinase regulating ubiquinone biosynthesis (AarF/ABC1/UbiB family)